MAARTLSVQNARRPVYHAAVPASYPSGTRRTIRRPPQSQQAPYRAAARPAAVQQPSPMVYRRPQTAAHRRKKRHTGVVMGKLLVLVLCFWALLSVFDLLAQQRLFASLGSLVSGHSFSTTAPAAETDDLPATGSGILSVQPVLQNPQLPNGCEAASLATLLQYSGFSVDLGSLAADYLPCQSFTYNGLNRYGPDPEKAYAGDPFSTTNGWYCFEGPVVEAANAYLRAQGSDLRAQAVTGADIAELEHLLRQGRPVAVWFTQDYEQPRQNTSFTWTLPNGHTYTPYANLHCVVLSGMDGQQCYLADPMQGSTSIPRDQFESIYTAMGSRAVVLR